MDDRELEKLFQEQLEDYRENPDPRVWNRIHSSLDKKKPTRVIPLWWRWGAAAAVLAGMLFVINPWEDSESRIPAVTGTEVNQDARSPEKGDTPDLNTPPITPVPSEVVAGKDPEDVQPGKAEGKPGNLPGKKSTRPEMISTKENTPQVKTLLASESQMQKSPGEEEGKASNSLQFNGQADLATAVKKPGNPELDSKGTLPENDALPLLDSDQKNEREAEALASKEDGKKSIFEAIEDEDAVAEQADKGGKWMVGPSLAPVYFDSFGNGSPISPNFVNNSKSGSVNMSYGLQVAYKVSPKISIRSGIHRVDYGYNTNEVGFTSSPSARPSSLIRSISYSENSKSLVVHSTAGGAREPQQPTAVDISAPSPARQGQMVQEFGYLEVPVEMQYTLIDKKWGLNLIGGMSSLFLMDNSVSLESSGTITEVGESNNMNSLNFSTNLGFGLFYRLNPRLELNLLPMFKYQLNTFSQTEGSFRPYSVGVYSGLSFRF
ncbi:outer membrane beta-barrel protein [Robiginitalea aurantiaca]|uniref:Outer membrane beta-barrel protein n=1 Tax=Robiginitalea aurantiaca TaxID=3056915 RepID=A0ABT7WAJ8_9FLAO|nr:outer membrane beta-barrel protein [Robiginitalea aurantiaca]MDM9629943.1 outer membrane beta-barrel protein [Robiginitalea aurantiaca]